MRCHKLPSFYRVPILYPSRECPASHLSSGDRADDLLSHICKIIAVIHFLVDPITIPHADGREIIQKPLEVLQGVQAVTAIHLRPGGMNLQAAAVERASMLMCIGMAGLYHQIKIEGMFVSGRLIGNPLAVTHDLLFRGTVGDIQFHFFDLIERDDIRIQLGDVGILPRKHDETASGLIQDELGLLVTIDTGTPEGFSLIREIRDYLISIGAHVIAPCTHMGVCLNTWCHFSTRVSRSKLHKDLKGGDAPYEDEKYCYIAFSKSVITPCKNRILRHPQINPGFVELEVCSKDGFKKIKYSKKDKELFKKARKSDAGDQI